MSLTLVAARFFDAVGDQKIFTNAWIERKHKIRCDVVCVVYYQLNVCCGTGLNDRGIA